MRKTVFAGCVGRSRAVEKKSRRLARSLGRTCPSLMGRNRLTPCEGVISLSLDSRWEHDSKLDQILEAIGLHLRMNDAMKTTKTNEFKALAIVGMACRFPKGLDSPDLLWNALQTRFSAIDTVPADRWTADRYFSSNAIAKGKAYIRRGGFLSQDISAFDASFFGISPRDAENMDPQQRLLLEVVWEAFENAGLSLPSYGGKGRRRLCRWLHARSHDHANDPFQSFTDQSKHRCRHDDDDALQSHLSHL